MAHDADDLALDGLKGQVDVVASGALTPIVGNLTTVINGAVTTLKGAVPVAQADAQDVANTVGSIVGVSPMSVICVLSADEASQDVTTALNSVLGDVTSDPIVQGLLSTVNTTLGGLVTGLQPVLNDVTSLVGNAYVFRVYLHRRCADDAS